MGEGGGGGQTMNSTPTRVSNNLFDIAGRNIIKENKKKTKPPINSLLTQHFSGEGSCRPRKPEFQRTHISLQCPLIE